MVTGVASELTAVTLISKIVFQTVSWQLEDTGSWYIVWVLIRGGVPCHDVILVWYLK